MSTSTVVLLRHGQSTSNAEDIFTGWVDAPLTQRGEEQAAQAGQWLTAAGPGISRVHTSLLSRTIRTADIVTRAMDLSWLPVNRSWRLNERHYGALTGRRKRDVAEQVDATTFRAWRRSFDTAPPAMRPGSAFDVSGDARYAVLPPDARPLTESLADVSARLLPYWYDVVVAQLRAGGTPLVVAHGNSLRALVMHLEGLNPDQVAELDIPTGVPMLYRFDQALRPLPPTGSRYLKPAAAEENIRVGRF